jgi:DNA-binding HxlR family transcriptional regulator
MVEKYLQYANKVPKEIRIATESLSGQNDLRWAIIIALIEEGASPFSDIREKLDIHQQRLTNALSALQRGGLIEKRAGDELGDEYSGEYAITTFGQKILDGYYEAASPKFESHQRHTRLEEVHNYNGAKVLGYSKSRSEGRTTVASDERLDERKPRQGQAMGGS